ncbi:hypothetical protein [Candidatus Manganitrophus noduliformans]|uniref:Secreted protein n=1 Tax=Candidatus Manganitrophus noduliformans TaxID=2606439 RepID=A0A7X6DP17_9BACT|nr:hypothetical protein [Candidatus Manganitrophus noduliformans]NKE70752.1 hypothetical protein [Candidatus Manganitrophus noduliformans]
MAHFQQLSFFKRFQKSNRRALFFFLILFQTAFPVWAAPPSEPEPPPSEAERIERALDEALNTLADGMQALVGLAEKSKEKWEQCQSGESKEEWCVKMKDALARLERLDEKGSPAPPESESSPPPDPEPTSEEETP